VDLDRGVLLPDGCIVMDQARIVLDSPVPSDIVKGDVTELSQEEEAAEREESGEGCREVVACFQTRDEIEHAEVFTIARDIPVVCEDV